MSRTKQEIANAMKIDFMSNTTLRNIYSFSDTDLFDQKFSSVSIEGLLIYIFASAAWLLESIFDNFTAEIKTVVDNSAVTTKPWYYAKSLAFQYGDNLVFNQSSSSFGYAVIDDTKQIVKYTAIREIVDNNVTKLKIYYSGANKQPLTTDQKTAFEAYIREVGAAGIHYVFVSLAPDALGVTMTVYYDALILNSSGMRISDGTYPVKDAIKSYIDNIVYGGVLYTSAMVDEIQKVEGVVDVVLTHLTHKGVSTTARKIESDSGAFILDDSISVITYNLD